MLGRRGRLDLVIRPVSLALSLLQQCLLWGAAVGVAWIVASRVVTATDQMALNTVRLSVGVAIVGGAVIAAALIVQFPPLRRVLGRTSAACKRLIFLACSRVPNGVERAGRTCRMISLDFRRYWLSHPSQSEAVSKIYRHIKAAADTRGTYDAVVGESGYGKTRCVTLLLEAIVRDDTIHYLADRCFYYDFACDSAIGDLYIRRLAGGTHAGALVIVDNFHLAGPDIVEETTKLLLEQPESAAEAHFVFLAQPAGAWRLRGQGEVRLFSEARRKGCLHEIGGLARSDLLRERLSEEARARLLSIASTARDSIASIAQVQSMQVERMVRPADRAFATAVADYLFVSAPGPHRSMPAHEAERLSKAMAIAVALAIQRGVFTDREFCRACLALTEATGFRRWSAMFGLWRLLRRLAKIGVVPRTTLPGRFYLLHERLAEDFRDRLGASDAVFERTFCSTMTWRLDSVTPGTVPILQWIGGAELRDPLRVERSFEPALLAGGLEPMTRRLAANLPHMDSPRVRLQMGILLDKSGTFQAAREEFSLVRVDQPADPLTDELDLAKLEAEHGQNRYEVVSRLRRSTSRKVRLSGMYWDIHMKAHAGTFDPDGLIRLAASITEHFDADTIRKSYSLFSLASRTYFDACRHAYLRREDVARRILALEALPLAGILETCDPTHQAGRSLYQRAHALGVLAIPDRALFDRISGPEELFGLHPTDTSLSALCEFALREYDLVRDEYSVYGDRNHDYLAAEILAVRLQHPVVDLEAIRPALADYEYFIRKSGFVDLLSYPEVYKFRFALRGWQAAMSGTEERSTFSDADDHLQQARRHLDAIERLDTACGNAYGLWRCRLYRTLLEALTSRAGAGHASSLKALDILASDAGKSGYVGDAVFVRRLIDAGDLRVAQAFNALVHHPFVHQ